MRYAIVSMPRDKLAADLTGAGSVAIVSYHIAKRLARSHSTVVVADTGAGQSAREQISPNFEIFRMRSRLAKFFKYRELAASIFEPLGPAFLADNYFCDYYAHAARALREFDPDVIHLQMYGQAAPVFKAHCPRARIVLQLHDNTLAQVDERTVRQVTGGVDLIVTCSEYVARSLRAAHPGLGITVASINNGVEPGDFDSRRNAASDLDRTTGAKQAGGADGAQRLIYIGRLSPEKGVHVLVDAFNRVVEERPHARLTLIGGPAMFAYSVVKLFKHDPHWSGVTRFYGSTPLQRLRRQLHNPGQQYAKQLRYAQSAAARKATIFQGEQSHRSIAASLAASDVLVMPSVCDEPFGIPVVEAMAAGIPVVASNAGGMAELVRDGDTGLLVPRSDPESLADALIRLLDNPSLRRAMGARGREIAASDYSWDCTVRNLMNALRSAHIVSA